MDKNPIISGLMRYIDEDVTSFYMPGHKMNKRGFEELNLIQDNLFKMDNTEVPGLDNLHMPEEMILDTEKNAEAMYGAGKSYLLVNGSTSGTYSMILGTMKPKDKIIIQRNCHRSIYSACLLGDLRTEYLYPVVDDRFKCAISLDINEVIRVMDENRDAKAIVLTYPTYYGTCCDLERIADEAHKRGVLVLVDEAHGAHFPVSEKLPRSAIHEGADVSVVSLHKTTPSMTQTALLNVREGLDIEGIRFMTTVFQTTSPSYIFMASIDGALSIMMNKGKELIDEVIACCNKLKEDLKGDRNYEFIGVDTNPYIKSFDPTRLVIKSSFGGKRLDDLLRTKYKIQSEMSDLYNTVFICTVGNVKEDFERLTLALKDISKNEKADELPETNLIYPKSIQKLSLREAYYSKKRRVKLSDAEGLISGEMVSPYPPGIPIVLPGEVITEDVIAGIETSKRNRVPLNGISDVKGEYIYVID